MSGFTVRAIAAAVVAALCPVFAQAGDKHPELAQAAPHAAFAQKGRLVGPDRQPLANAAYRIDAVGGATVATGSSDTDGGLRLPALAPGNYSISVERAGKAPWVGSLVVTGGAADLGSVTVAPIQQLATVEIASKRLDAARNALSPDTGSSIYHFDEPDIKALPLGESTPLNQVLLRAPGVVQDSFGQLHVRGDHGNLQYRVNGVVIPEPITGFGQALDTRFADEIGVLTGALPAQYGYRTAGIVDLKTKTAVENGGEIGVLGGGNEHRETNGHWGGTQGPLSWYFTGSYLENDLGIENPTRDKSALHDKTRQKKGFGYLSYLLDNDSRVSLLFGVSDGHFQIPDRPGLSPAITWKPNGGTAVTPPASESLNASQREQNHFEILSYQGSLGNQADYQLSLFHRRSIVDYSPDPLGDLLYNGIAGRIHRQNDATGSQGDLSYRLNPLHTLRGGFFVQQERFNTGNDAQVFQAANCSDNPDGSQTCIDGAPTTIQDNSTIHGHLYGFYLQDEWKPTNKLTVNYGARFDKVDTVVSEQQLSPRLGLVYDLDGRTRLHAGYARYFTPPPTELINTTTVALFSGTTNDIGQGANTAVKSERSNYYDIGLSHQLTRHVTLGVDAYYRQIRHLQDEGQFGNALVYSAFNYEKGRVYGLELSSTYRNHGLSAYANLALSRAMGKGIETGQFNFESDELAYIANHWVHLDHDQSWAGSAGASYLWHGATWSADALFGSGLRSTPDGGAPNSDHLSPYIQVNLGASRPFDLPGIGRLTGRLAVINAFDRVYELRDGTGIGVGAPQYGPRRTFYAGLSKAF